MAFMWARSESAEGGHGKAKVKPAHGDQPLADSQQSLTLTLSLEVKQWTVIQLWVTVLCWKRCIPLFQFLVGPFHLGEALFNVSGSANNPCASVFIKLIVVANVVLGFLCRLDQELGLDFLVQLHGSLAMILKSSTWVNM